MSIHSVTLSEAEGHLAELAQIAEMGKEVVISREDGSVIKLIIEKQPRRIFGQYHGQITISDDFDDELPNDFWQGKAEE